MATTSTNAYDAIVIGGGHNGLITAAYLGKAGLRTVLVERRAALGGATGTSELAPGARVPTLAHTVGRLRPSVVRDLDLKRHGLSLVGPEVRVFAPGPDGDAVVLWGDAARTAEGLRARSADDAGQYAAFDRLVRSLAGFPARSVQTPLDIESPGLDAFATQTRADIAVAWPSGRPDDHASCRWRRDFAESFESDARQAAIAWRGVQYTSMGPWSAGTTAVLLIDAAGNDGGAAGQTVYVSGGPGALTAALAAAAVEASVEIRTVLT
jgi:phytoene dehydrogenase-like protein